MIIKSSTTLRNDYGVISELANKSNEPIYITKNGEGDIVIMSIEFYERREQILKLKTKLAIAERARIEGCETISINEARKRLEDKYNVQI